MVLETHPYMSKAFQSRESGSACPDHHSHIVSALRQRGFIRRSLCQGLLIFLSSTLLAGCAPAFLNEVGRGNLEAVEAMLADDPSVLTQRDDLGKTALHRAVTSGKDDMVALILSHTPDVDAQDDTGLTPLHVAAWWTTPSRMQLLLDAGANLEAKDKFGDTPLHLAAIHGRLANIRFLVEHGADTQARNQDNLTPREAAIKYHQDKAAHFLAQLGNGS